MLKNVPKKKWQEGPCMTIFGCMVNRNFINYLLKVIAMQTDIFTHGRIQLFVVMRPSDYIVSCLKVCLNQQQFLIFVFLDRN